MSSEKEEPRDIKERTFQFALDIVRFCRELDRRSGVGRSLGRQLLRAGTSIGANVEEAKAGHTRADFLNKYAIALKEARETLYWLRLLGSAGEVSHEECRRLTVDAQEIANILGSIIVKARSGRP